MGHNEGSSKIQGQSTKCLNRKSEWSHTSNLTAHLKLQIRKSERTEVDRKKNKTQSQNQLNRNKQTNKVNTKHQ